MEITTELVNHLAELSRLEFDEKEIENFKGEFEQTLKYIDEISSVDISGVQLESKTADAQQDLEADIPHISLSKDEVVKDAPDTMGSSIAVPMMVD